MWELVFSLVWSVSYRLLYMLRYIATMHNNTIQVMSYHPGFYRGSVC